MELNDIDKILNLNLDMIHKDKYRIKGVTSSVIKIGSCYT